MNVATGEVLTDLRKSHTGADVLRFFKQIDAAVPRELDVHVVLDNLSAHSTPEIAKWLAHKDRRRWRRSRLAGGVNGFGRRFPQRSGKSEEGAYVRVEEGIAC